MGRIPLRFVMVLLVLLPAVASAAGDGGWTVAALMELLGGRGSGQATYTERKYLAMLDRPVESSGELRYRAPDRLEKTTVAPKAESLVLEGDTLTVTRGERQHVLRLSDYPEAAAFVDSIRGTLAGDRTALERAYALHLSGTRARWTLNLLPREARMADVVHRITIRGAEASLKEIEILQANGDRSVMEIHESAAGG